MHNVMRAEQKDADSTQMYYYIIHKILGVGVA